MQSTSLKGKHVLFGLCVGVFCAFFIVSFVNTRLQDSSSLFGKHVSSSGSQTRILHLLQSAGLAPSSDVISHSQEDGDQTQQLLLITSGRSGSSFTASIINNSPEVFHTFEPLRVVGATRNNAHNASVAARATELVKGYLTCDFTNTTATDLDEIFLLKNGKESRQFYYCQHENASGYTHIECLWAYIKYCKRQRLHFSKLIRFPMILLEPLLKELPNLKVIYLIRDPRAVLHSMASAFGGFKWPLLVDHPTKEVCRFILEDIIELKRLYNLYPGRLKLVRYENGVLDPIAYAKDLYSFAGLDFTNRTQQYINSLGNGTVSDDKDKYSVVRNDPVKLIGQWRYSKGSYESALNIDQYCVELLPLAGYYRVTSQEQLLSDKPLFNKHFSFP